MKTQLTTVLAISALLGLGACWDSKTENTPAATPEAAAPTMPSTEATPPAAAPDAAAPDAAAPAAPATGGESK